MQRITITVDDELVAALDRVIAACGYQNRSEAIRDLTRAGSPSSKSRAITRSQAWRLSSTSMIIRSAH